MPVEGGPRIRGYAPLGVNIRPPSSPVHRLFSERMQRTTLPLHHYYPQLLFQNIPWGGSKGPTIIYPSASYPTIIYLPAIIYPISSPPDTYC